VVRAPAEEGATGERAKRIAVLRERHRRYEAELELAKDAAQFEGPGARAKADMAKDGGSDRVSIAVCVRFYTQTWRCCERPIHKRWPSRWSSRFATRCSS